VEKPGRPADHPRPKTKHHTKDQLYWPDHPSGASRLRLEGTDALSVPFRMHDQATLHGHNPHSLSRLPLCQGTAVRVWLGWVVAGPGSGLSEGPVPGVRPVTLD
jgi:hypothetical protein